MVGITYVYIGMIFAFHGYIFVFLPILLLSWMFFQFLTLLDVIMTFEQSLMLVRALSAVTSIKLCPKVMTSSIVKN